MIEYGFINEENRLISSIIEETVEHYQDEEGILQSRILSIDDQIEVLKNNGWKPVDPIDEVRLTSTNAFESVRLEPYNNGDIISYHYTVISDANLIKKEIENLKSDLSNSDYKITKCYEATLIRDPLPYDIRQLHIERQAIRDEINKLQSLLKD